MAQKGRNLVVYDLGMVEYEDGLVLQNAFALARRGRLKRDVLLLLEHSPVLTMGRGAVPDDIKVSPQELERHGIGVFRTDRGGNVTYHGPGQIVGYPIIDLAPDRCDVRRYVRDLEDTMIGALGEFGVKAGRIDGWTGVWVGEKGKDARKIGAIGVHLSRWVTTHGFALNLTTDLSHFDFIVPCGIREAGVTSVERELGRAPSMEAMKEALSRNLAKRLGASQHRGRIDQRTVSVAVLRRAGEGFEALLLKRHPHRGGFWQPITGTVERGEKPRACAARELREESGLDGVVDPLGYVHSFLFGEPRAERTPRIFQETAFWTLVDGRDEVRLDAREHLASEWVPIAEAIERVPFAGLKSVIRRAARRAAVEVLPVESRESRVESPTARASPEGADGTDISDEGGSSVR
ncbi:MAG: lipoyl(octanoyl) transferase LipB [Myxococcales bacterium]|jgi:lipoyl(octanoyl) transferase